MQTVDTFGRTEAQVREMRETWKVICASQQYRKGYAKLYHSKGELKAQWLSANRTSADAAIAMLKEHDNK